jgi:hypothetical protein
VRAEEDSRRAQQGLPVSNFIYMVDAPPHCSFSLLASFKLPTVGLGRGRSWR